MKKILLTGSAAFACIPGLAAIISGLGAPPNAGVWFGGVGTMIGVFAILAVTLYSEKLAHVPIRRLSIWSALTLGFAILSLTTYAALFDWCVVNHPAYGTVVYPLWTSNNLAKMIEQAGGRWNALDRYGTYAIDVEIRKSSSAVWALTIGTFVVFYSAWIGLFSAAFALLAVRLEGRRAENRGPSRQTTTRRRKKRTSIPPGIGQ